MGSVHGVRPVDDIRHPAHYAGNGIECIQAMESMMHGADAPPFMGYLWGNAFKYLWRWHLKGGSHDLLKAIRYLQMMLVETGGEDELR